MRFPESTPGLASSAIWICDVNGVLIDSTSVVREAFAATAARFRILLQPDALRRVNGRLLPDAYRVLHPGGDPVAASRFHLSILRERLGEMRAYDDVAETLAAARAAGVRIAAVTSYGEIAEASLVRSGLYPSIDCLVTQEEVRHPKPHPESLFRALALLGRRDASRGTQALYVGDTAIDIQAGRAAGLRTIAVTGGAANESELREAHPDDIVACFGAMRGMLTEYRRRTDHARDLPRDGVLPPPGKATTIASRADNLRIHEREL